MSNHRSDAIPGGLSENDSMGATQPLRLLRRPRLGFAGVGWIGRHRLEAVHLSGAGHVLAIADPIEHEREAAGWLVPAARQCTSLGLLLEEAAALELDGIVIATPSALHAEQTRAALSQGLAVFCQKPLGRTAVETRAVVDAARAADRLLEVDLSYRYTAAMQQIRALIAAGAIGDIYAVDLTFHNAYGPDKPWFYNRALSGGGCVMDLGVHLVDLALWTLGFPEVTGVHSRLMAGGALLKGCGEAVEDYAAVQLELSSGTVVQMRCSWRLPAGRDAIIEAAFYGTRGGAAMRNVNGSFYDFVAEHYTGTSTATVLAEPPDAWGGRAVVAWARKLAVGTHFDQQADALVSVAKVLDRIYAASARVPDQRCGESR